ncbi:MAG TPA: hypothetical protein DDW98_00420 [Gammaproteobacteria bacterium]|jgi:hypothetical protein|nr:hypothetical protein [Gammaproteobacteria bacterium]
MRAKVYLIPKAAILPILRGEKRVANIPTNAECVAADSGVMGFGLRVHCDSFDDVPFGKQLPLVPAVIERRAE